MKTAPDLQQMNKQVWAVQFIPEACSAATQQQGACYLWVIVAGWPPALGSSSQEQEISDKAYIINYFLMGIRGSYFHFAKPLSPTKEFGNALKNIWSSHTIAWIAFLRKKQILQIKPLWLVNCVGSWEAYASCTTTKRAEDKEYPQLSDKAGQSKLVQLSWSECVFTLRNQESVGAEDRERRILKASLKWYWIYLGVQFR